MLDIPPSLDTLSLKKPAPGPVPKERLCDPAQAISLVGTLIYANQARNEADAQVKGMLDGNAPFSQAALVSEGQGNRTNVNFLEGDAILDAAKTPYCDLFAEAATYFQIEVDRGNQYERATWSRTVTSEFDALLKEWIGFDWNIQMMLHDLIAYGVGYCMWEDGTNWRFRTIRKNKVLVPDGTPSDPDCLDVMVIRQALTVSDLYKRVRNKDAARAVGWNVDATMNACARAQPEYRTTGVEFDYEAAQQRIRNNDIYESTRSDVVRIAHLLVKEFDGRVSHLVIEEDDGARALGNLGGRDPKKIGPEFIFKRIGRFESFRQVIAPMFYDIGDGTWHSMKGLAKKLYPFVTIKNRLNCALVDNAFVMMSVLVRPNTANAANEAALMQIGPLSVLPAGFDIQNWGLAGRMEEGLAVERALSYKLESNIGSYRRPLFKEQGNPETATKVQYEAGKEAALSKGAVNRFYTQMDLLGGEIYRRASNPNLVDDNKGPNSLALEFQNRCLEAGVPKAALLKPRFIRATRNAGNGSIFLRQQVIATTAQFVPMFNEAGRQNWLDDAIAIMAGTENVNRWNPKQQMDPNLTDQAVLATLENNSLMTGSPALWSPTQNNFIHALTHLKAAFDGLQSVPSGGDPVKVVTFIESLLPHVAIHLQQLRRDTTQGRQSKVIEDQLGQVAQAAAQLRSQLQQAMAQQQKAQQQALANQQRVMTDTELKQAELNAKLEMQRAKTENMIALKQQKHEQNLALSDARVAANINLRNQEAIPNTTQQ